MRGERPSGRRFVDEQTERAAGLLGAQMDLRANAAGHPDDLSRAAHVSER
jgi:hypothetical protein